LQILTPKYLSYSNFETTTNDQLMANRKATVAITSLMSFQKTKFCSKCHLPC